MPHDNPDSPEESVDPDAILMEGDDGPGHSTPGDLLELYEVLEWEAAVEEAAP